MKFAFLCGNASPGYPWCDDNYERGIGGAEECLILLTRELAKLGHDVTVYNECSGLEGVYKGVEWTSYQDRLLGIEDVIVSWRQAFLLEGIEYGKRWLWTHDMDVYPHLPRPDQLQWIDKVVTLNEYHYDQYANAGVPRHKLVIGGTAVDVSLFNQKIERIPGRVIAFYHPKRGLDRLHNSWSAVRMAIPHATLAGFWWQPELFLPPDEEFGILPMRHLGPCEIAAEILRADVFAYPATGTETAPLTAIKAQCGGAYPVVVPVGGMNETIQYGTKTSLTMFTQRLIEALRMMPQWELRETMMSETRARYSWAHVAERWVAMARSE